MTSDRVRRELYGRPWFLGGARVESWARTVYWHRFVEVLEVGLRAEAG